MSRVQAIDAHSEPYWFCDINFIKHLMPVSVVKPCSRWKAGYFFAMAAVGTGLYFLNEATGFGSWFITAFKHEDDALLVYTSAIDFIMVLAATYFARYEPAAAPMVEARRRVAVGQPETKRTPVRMAAIEESSESSVMELSAAEVASNHRAGAGRGAGEAKALPSSADDSVSRSSRGLPPRHRGRAVVSPVMPTTELQAAESATGRGEGEAKSSNPSSDDDLSVMEMGLPPRSFATSRPPASGVSGMASSVLSRPGQMAKRDLALVIPAHKFKGRAAEVLKAALVHLNQEQIILVNNAEGGPKDNLRKHIHDTLGYPRITVVDYDHGNKTYSQYIGARIAALMGYRVVLSTDDDVILPPGLALHMDVAELSRGFSALTYGLEPIPEHENSGAWGKFWVSMQRLEYNLSAQHKLFEQRTAGSVYFPPGAIMMCKTREFVDILRRVNCRFHGEDVNIGMEILKADHKIAISSRQFVQTKAPDSFAMLYKQRVSSWDKVFYVNFFRLVLVPFAKFRPDLRDNLVLKLVQVYMLHSVIANVIRVPMMASLGSRDSFWLRFAAYFVATLFPVFVWNMLKVGPKMKRPDLKASWLAILVFPLYKALSHVFSFLALLNTIFLHWPNYKRIATIPNLEATPLIGDGLSPAMADLLKTVNEQRIAEGRPVVSELDVEWLLESQGIALSRVPAVASANDSGISESRRRPPSHLPESAGPVVEFGSGAVPSTSTRADLSLPGSTGSFSLHMGSMGSWVTEDGAQASRSTPGSGGSHNLDDTPVAGFRPVTPTAGAGVGSSLGGALSESDRRRALRRSALSVLAVPAHVAVDVSDNSDSDSDAKSETSSDATLSTARSPSL